MRPIPRTALKRLLHNPHPATPPKSAFHYSTAGKCPRSSFLILGTSSARLFSTSSTWSQESERSINATPYSKLNQNVTQKEKDHYHEQIVKDKERQVRTPWHRAESDTPPVVRNRSAGAMTKGKLLTTPSRMLKLILPLTTKDANTDRKDVEPLALLVHPQQPLSYLERLIQSELPMMSDSEGRNKVPAVWFRAEDSMQEKLEHKKKISGTDEEKFDDEKEKEDEEKEGENKEEAEDRHMREREKARKEKERARETKTKEKDERDVANPDEVNIGGVVHKTGKLNKHTPSEAAEMRGGPGEGGIEVYSGLGQSRPAKEGEGEEGDPRFVRWSNSTEIGDFIRDAARGREFAVEIEGAPKDIRVGVPSFLDRTFYLRMRLRGLARKISTMADVKRECDAMAHRGAQRVAMGGFGILCGWWYVVYRLTFETELGWDVMEPVTYLVGLSTLIGGYIWFLWHNREVSYRSAMNLTISRRQSKLYEQRGFDMTKWQALVEEGNALRKEIKGVAESYDVQWDESEDEGDDKVKEALRKDREDKKKGKRKDDKDSD